MSKKKYIGEFDTRASKKMLFPYLNTAGGLAQWFADDVSIDDDKVYHFHFDGEDHPARMITQKLNSHVKFEFLDDEDEEDNSYMEIRLEQNEITESVFIQITDYSDWEDENDIREIWEGLIDELNDIVGG